jgi:uncharacterized membrane protein
MTTGLVVVLARYCYSTIVRKTRRPGEGSLDNYQHLRVDIGRVILLGLEILIIGDIVRTIIVDASLQSVLVLGLIVMIRIVLSFALEVEISGNWPWQQNRPHTSSRRTVQQGEQDRQEES